jgi:hypothetical protein
MQQEASAQARGLRPTTPIPSDCDGGIHRRSPRRRINPLDGRGLAAATMPAARRTRRGAQQRQRKDEQAPRITRGAPR